MEKAIDLIIESKTRELTDDFKIRRVLPHAKRRMVGAFIFLDQMGPEIISAGKSLDVAPHPHIGLATVTYLFQGELMHRDSIGSKQLIRPGDVNWMTAGKGIAHSERTPENFIDQSKNLYGIQAWVALPKSVEETEPSFFHHGQQELPVFEGEGKKVRLIAGSLFGEKSPVNTASEIIYADVAMKKNSRFAIPKEHEERAIYIIEGSLETGLEGEKFDAGRLLVLKPSEEIIIKCISPTARFLLLGGEPLEKRHIWWNFVSSSHERIEQAKEDWKNQNFDRVVDESEYIPLPGTSEKMVIGYP
jgi:redox-sensitive bicupin YhaK (pirin superfamily)